MLNKQIDSWVKYNRKRNYTINASSQDLFFKSLISFNLSIEFLERELNVQTHPSGVFIYRNNVAQWNGNTHSVELKNKILLLKHQYPADFSCNKLKNTCLEVSSESENTD